jgi:glycerol uptake facilitator-like aquaporin
MLTHHVLKVASTARDRTRRCCTVRAMITPQGYGLIAELIATALLIAALTGLFVRRSKPWLVAVTIAFMILIVAVAVIVASST